MTTTQWTEADTRKARQVWAEYERTHDLSGQRGWTAGIDPVSGRVWFGESIEYVVEQMQAKGEHALLYFLRIGSDHYFRKGAQR